MNVQICRVPQIKLFARGAKVAFLIPVGTHYVVELGNEKVTPDVEFSFVVQ